MTVARSRAACWIAADAAVAAACAAAGVICPAAAAAAARLGLSEIEQDVVGAAVDQHELVRVEAAVRGDIGADLVVDRDGGRLRERVACRARRRVADARLQRHARAALRVVQAGLRRERHAEAAGRGGCQRVAVILRDVLREDLARIRREAAAAEGRGDDRRIRAGVRQAVAERHDLQLDAARRRRVVVVVVAAAAARGEQCDCRARGGDLCKAHHGAADRVGLVHRPRLQFLANLLMSAAADAPRFLSICAACAACDSLPNLPASIRCFESCPLVPACVRSCRFGAVKRRVATRTCVHPARRFRMRAFDGSMKVREMRMTAGVGCRQEQSGIELHGCLPP